VTDIASLVQLAAVARVVVTILPSGEYRLAPVDPSVAVTMIARSPAEALTMLRSYVRRRRGDAIVRV